MKKQILLIVVSSIISLTAFSNKKVEVFKWSIGVGAPIYKLQLNNNGLLMNEDWRVNYNLNFHLFKKIQIQYSGIDLNSNMPRLNEVVIYRVKNINIGYSFLLGKYVYITPLIGAGNVNYSYNSSSNWSSFFGQSFNQTSIKNSVTDVRIESKLDFKYGGLSLTGFKMFGNATIHGLLFGAHLNLFRINKKKQKVKDE